MSNTNNETLLEHTFLESALKRSAFARQKDPKNANREYDNVHAIKDELRKLPDRGEAALKRIVTTDDVEVQILAAAALLAVDENYALGVLEKISKHAVGLSSLTAEMTIKEWRKGALSEHWK